MIKPPFNKVIEAKIALQPDFGLIMITGEDSTCYTIKELVAGDKWTAARRYHKSHITQWRDQPN